MDNHGQISWTIMDRELDPGGCDGDVSSAGSNDRL